MILFIIKSLFLVAPAACIWAVTKLTESTAKDGIK